MNERITLIPSQDVFNINDGDVSDGVDIIVDVNSGDNDDNTHSEQIPYEILYKIYKSIVKNYNQLKKFKDPHGKLILTSHQLTSLLSVLLNIGSHDISISYEPKVIKKYSDGKIFKIRSFNINSTNLKNHESQINRIATEFGISIEFVNDSVRMNNE